MPSFSTADGEFAYLDKGDGQPVVLVHGFASSARVNWLDTGWMDWLIQAGYRAIALDNRGHGDSVKLHHVEDYHLDKMSDDVLSLIDHLELPRVRAIGYSMGARILLDFASRHSERLEQLVLAGIGGAMAKAGLDREPIAAALLAPTLDDVDDPVGRGYRLFADQTRSDRRALAACIPLQWAFTHTPLMQDIFGSADLSVQEWAKVLGAGLLVFFVAELEKFVIRRSPMAARLVHA